MIEFHAGTGPDTQAIGIALEEMFLDYRIVPGRAPVPVIAIGGARVVGCGNILMALARKTGRFLPQSEDVARWLDPAQPDLIALDTLLASSIFVAGQISVADMALYPRLVANRDALAAHANIARWTTTMLQRPATGRGLSVVVRVPISGR
jgi:glutathione S-transferase